MAASDLRIILKGGCSMPLREVAEHIERVLSTEGLSVTIEDPRPGTRSHEGWLEGWEAEPEDLESVVIQTGN